MAIGPGMPPSNNSPWWAPGRPLIVSDPQKMTYFAQANAIRAGIQSMPSALSGVGVGDGEWANPFSAEDTAPGDDRAFTSSSEFFNSTVMADNRVLPGGVANANPVASGANVETNSGGGTLDSFFNAINRFVKPAPTYRAPTFAPSPWPWVIGLGVAGLGLMVLMKKRKA